MGGGTDHHHHHELEKRAMQSFRNLSSRQKLHPENFERWSALELADFLQSCGLGDYSEMVVQHGITGQVAPRLTEHDLKEMGISVIGDRKRFTAAIETVQKAARKVEREKTIWSAEQVLWVSWWDGCRGTGCGCCPVDAAQYKLTGTHLQIKTPMIRRCGPIRCCCGHEYTLDNLDLTYVTDADVRGESPNCCHLVCCCGHPLDHVRVTTSTDGVKTLTLHKGEGETVSRKIMNQVEETQRIERD